MAEDTRERSKRLRERATALINSARGIRESSMALRDSIDARKLNAPLSSRMRLIVVAASAGGVSALKEVVAGLPAGLHAAVVIVLHRKPGRESHLEAILGRETAMPVKTAAAGERMQRGVIYIARPDAHLTVTADGRFAYGDGTRVRGVLSAANPLFDSASKWFGGRVIAVVLSGSGWDATDGVQAIKAAGGRIIVQDPASAGVSGMPSAAVRTGVVDSVLPVEQIAAELISIVEGREHDGNRGPGAAAAA